MSSFLEAINRWHSEKLPIHFFKSSFVSSVSCCDAFSADRIQTPLLQQSSPTTGGFVDRWGTFIITIRFSKLEKLQFHYKMPSIDVDGYESVKSMPFTRLQEILSVSDKLIPGTERMYGNINFPFLICSSNFWKP